METLKEKKAWKEVKASKRFLNAFRGLYVFVATERHFSVIVFTVFMIIVMGFYFNISEFEWLSLVFAIGFVIVSEILNSAIEIDIDLTSPEYHPYARDTKDVAAGAVLISFCTAVIVWLIIFLPKIF